MWWWCWAERRELRGEERRECRRSGERDDGDGDGDGAEQQVYAWPNDGYDDNGFNWFPCVCEHSARLVSICRCCCCCYCSSSCQHWLQTQIDKAATKREGREQETERAGELWKSISKSKDRSATCTLHFIFISFCSILCFGHRCVCALY